MKHKDVMIEQVKAIPTPAPTKTWTPVGHHDLVTIVDDQIEKAGLEVVNSRYDLSVNGAMFFASMTLNIGGSKDSQFMFGYRNSLDMSLALGFTAGISIMVCSNMVFSGDYLTYRRHTAGLSMIEVEQLAYKAVVELPSQKKVFDDKLLTYNEVELNPGQHKELAYDLLTEGVLKPTQFPDYHKAISEEQTKGKNIITLNTVHNGITRLNRKHSLLHIATLTPKLTRICDDYHQLRLAA